MKFSSDVLKIWSFQKIALKYDLSYIIWKDGFFFFPKTSYFFFGWEMKVDLSQEIHGNTIFSVSTSNR